MRSTIRYVALALALGAPVAAQADPKADAQVHIERASAAFEKNDFEVAARELEAANTLDPQPDLLYAIGQAYVQLDRCPEALTYYRRYLETKPPAQASADTKQAIETCEAKATPAPTEPVPTDPVSPMDPVAPPDDLRASPPSRAATRPWYKDPLGDALVIGGVAAVVIGGIVYGGARSTLDDAEEAGSLAEYNDLVDQAQSRRTMSVLLVGGGAILVGAGIARFVLRDTDGDEARVGVVPTTSGGFVTVGGSF